MSGQGPLFRIAVTCAVIVIGSAVVGSQLATTGSLSRIASGVSDEEDDAIEEPGHASRDFDRDPAESDTEDDAEALDEDASEDDAEEIAEETTEDAPEGDTGSIAEEESGEAADGEPEDEGGYTVVRRKP